jgi:phthalate 4,5-cis-dihydrodiol dehydrogenase
MFVGGGTVASLAEQASKATQSRPLRIGLLGIGVGAGEVIPAMAAMEEIDLVAAADVVPATRELFKQRYPETNVYDSAEALVQDPDVEAVWIATPNRFHAPHTVLAANHGKHVVVEKPMATSLQEAEQMVEAAAKNGTKLLAGHTQAYSPPVRAMRRILTSGELGKLRAVNILSYSDWMLRPRTADELDINQGGGIPYRQGPHQIDTVRMLGGGLLRSVRGMTGDWEKSRPIPGYYSAYLEFEDGTPATIIHNGYGYFLGNELVPWGESRQQYNVEERNEIRRQLRSNSRKETEDKQALRIGGQQERVVTQRMDDTRPWLPTDLGLLIVTCERGDMRHSKYGVSVYDDNGLHAVPIDKEGRGRRAELTELYDAVVLGKPVIHDGRWGMATLEVCLAIATSARTHRAVRLAHQTASPR